MDQSSGANRALQYKGAQTALHADIASAYYGAFNAHRVGETGRPVALELDSLLAARDHENLKASFWVEMSAPIRRPMKPARSRRFRRMPAPIIHARSGSAA